MCTNIFLTSRCNVLQYMTVKDTKKEHHNKSEAEAVISVAQVTAIVRVRNARDSHEMEKISNNGKTRMLARRRRGNW